MVSGSHHSFGRCNSLSKEPCIVNDKLKIPTFKLIKVQDADLGTGNRELHLSMEKKKINYNFIDR
jgi:hypothetical protein